MFRLAPRAGRNSLSSSPQRVDAVAWLTADRFVARLEFIVNRFDDVRPPAPTTGRSYTACRLIMPLPAALDLHAKLGWLIATLRQQNVLIPIPQPPPEGGRHTHVIDDHAPTAAPSASGVT